jgi:hypothetical protein
MISARVLKQSKSATQNVINRAMSGIKHGYSKEKGKIPTVFYPAFMLIAGGAITVTYACTQDMRH